MSTIKAVLRTSGQKKFTEASEFILHLFLDHQSPVARLLSRNYAVVVHMSSARHSTSRNEVNVEYEFIEKYVDKQNRHTADRL